MQHFKNMNCKLWVFFKFSFEAQTCQDQRSLKVTPHHNHTHVLLGACGMAAGILGQSAASPKRIDFLMYITAPWDKQGSM